MIAKAEDSTSSVDTVKLWAAAALLVAGLVLFYVFAEQSLLFRTLGLLAVMAVCLFLVYQTTRGKNIVSFFRDARTEVRKVVWPSRAETTQTSLTVFIIVVIVGIMLWLFDSLLAMLFRYVTTGAF